jgi:hypothetical protein
VSTIGTRFVTGIKDNGGKLAIVTANVVDTGGKFATAVNNGKNIRLLTL